jgi:hypothetical protein
VLGDIGHGGPFDAGGGVVPTDVRAWLVLVRVIPVTGFGGQIDPTDEGDAIVDHDRLFVMTVKRAFRVVERVPPPDPGQTARVMAADLLGDLPADPALDREKRAPEQAQRLGVA